MQTKLTLTLSPEEVNLLLGALGELPAKVSMALVLEIKKQCDPQMPPAQEVLDKDE